MSAIVDPRRALLALLNVVVDDRDRANRAAAFIATYGPLRETYLQRLDPKSEAGKKAKESFGFLSDAVVGPPYTPQDAVIHFATRCASSQLLFSDVTRLPEEGDGLTLLNKTLQAAFNSPVTIDGVVHKTALDIDIVEGTVEPIPRDLTDAIALELLRSRKVISRCGICEKFFYKSFSKDKYCSPACASEARRRGQTEWARKRATEKEQSRQRTKKRTKH